jgi:hypothetical protein
MGVRAECSGDEVNVTQALDVSIGRVQQSIPSAFGSSCLNHTNTVNTTAMIGISMAAFSTLP